MSPYSPEYDNKIQKKYSSKTLSQKVENKSALQASLGIEEDTKRFTICIPTGVISAEETAMLLKLLPGVEALGAQVLLVARGSEESAKQCSEAQEKYADTLRLVQDEDAALRTMYAAADASLFLANCEHASELEHALHYGAVPICLLNERVQNYDAIQESGTAFTYNEVNLWHVFAAVVRAKETYQFPYDYKTIQRNCMESVKSEE